MDEIIRRPKTLNLVSVDSDEPTKARKWDGTKTFDSAFPNNLRCKVE